jgi:hypothetical protein
MGFDFEVRREKLSWETVLLALQTFRSINGNLLVPFAYSVPLGDVRWPQELWGIKLGTIVNGIRIRDYYKSHKSELLSMGFVYDKLRNRTCWKKPKA